MNIPGSTPRSTAPAAGTVRSDHEIGGSSRNQGYTGVLQMNTGIFKAVLEIMPWQGLQYIASQAEKELFQSSISIRLGNGEDCLFWSDKWLDGQSISSLAPSIVNSVPSSIKRTRLVSEGLSNGTWITDIFGDLNVQAITEYLGLWDRLQHVHTLVGQQDAVVWRWEGFRSLLFPFGL